MTGKQQHRRLDQKARYKRLMHVLNYPEDAVDQAEVDRAVRYGEYLTGELHEAIDTVDDLLADDLLWDELHALSDRMAKSLDELRGAIEEAEAALVSKYQGRCAAVELDEKWPLLFWHLKERWGLYTLNPKGAMQKLTSAPKHVRLLAVPALEDLWHQLQYEDE